MAEPASHPWLRIALRRRAQRWILLGCLIASVALVGPARGEGTMGGGEWSAPIDGLQPDALAEILAQASRRSRAMSPAANPPEKFSFHPMGGTLYGDLFTFNFVDLDPTGGALDWDCTDYSYDGHDGSDVTIRTFSEQEIGVPVFAALDGTVFLVHDGEDDMHTACFGPANYVSILHPGHRLTQYLHLKKNSILVSAGQEVRAGEQIGLVGSSGCSTAPHLHFATYDLGTVVEPYAGACRPGESEWVDQTPIERDLYVWDLNVTDADLSTWPGPPIDTPRTGTFLQGVQTVRFWMFVANRPAASTYRIRYRRPDDSLALDTGPLGWGGAFYRLSAYWWGFNLSLNQPGTWHIEFEANGSPLADAPFEVVATAEEVVNRPPNAIGVDLEPDDADVEDVLVCRVSTDLVLDDPDYDVVEYRYLWTEGANVLRDVTSAAHSDALPHHSVPGGSTVLCSVTPSDGIDTGPPAQDLVTVSALPPEVPALAPPVVAALAGLVVGLGVWRVMRRTRP